MNRHPRRVPDTDMSMNSTHVMSNTYTEATITTYFCFKVVRKLVFGVPQYINFITAKNKEIRPKIRCMKHSSKHRHFLHSTVIQMGTLNNNISFNTAMNIYFYKITIFLQRIQNKYSIYLEIHLKNKPNSMITLPVHNDGSAFCH